MATFDRIGGAEPSTLTFKLATVTQTRNSSKMHQEIQTIGDPDSSLALAAVLGSVPASTSFGLVVRQVGTLPTSGDSTVFQGSSAWQVQVTNQTRVSNSTAGDFLAQISGNSTVFQGGGAWSIQGNSTVFQGGTWTVRANLSSTSADNPVRANFSSTAADNPVLVSGNSTVAPLAGSTWATRPIQSSAADLQMTATPAAGSTWNVRCLQSSAADLQVTATQTGTWTFQLGTGLQSTAAPSSNSSGIVVRQVVDNILTTASTNALVSSALTIQSSGAGLRSYVVAYSILSTNAGPNKLKFYSGSTMLWPVVFAAVSSAVSGANLAVSAPAYLFRTKSAGPLSLNLASSLAGFQAAVSYFRAP